MKFIINSTNLLKQLTAIQGIIHSSSVVDILENFLFLLEKNKLSIVACDLETTALVSMDVESEDTGKICIPSKILIDSLKSLPDQPLTFTINQEKNLIETTSKSGKYKITGNNPSDFPKIPEPDQQVQGLNINVNDFSFCVSRTLVAVSQDDMKPEMNGVLLELEKDCMRMVSTDSHRLVVVALNNISPSVQQKMIIPKKPLILLKSILTNYEGEVHIQTSDNHFFLTLPNFQLACRLIDAKFPDYNAVIPEKNPFKMTLNNSDLQSSLNRVGVFSNKSTHMVKLDIKGQNLNLFAQDLDYAFEANENIACQYEGEDLTIGFNSKFLAELLRITPTEDVIVELSSSSKPAILLPSENVKNYDLKILLMPLMIHKT